MDEAQSSASAGAGFPHHVTDTIAEEEQGEGDLSEGDHAVDPNWPAAASAVAAGAGTDWAQRGNRGAPGGSAGSEGVVDAGQNWNWAWLAGQLPSEHGGIDPNTLLDDESEGEGGCLVTYLCPIRGLKWQIQHLEVALVPCLQERHMCCHMCLNECNGWCFALYT